MESNEFIRIRMSLGKSRKQLASLLGVSRRTIQSYEQGCRRVPAHIQKELYFFLFNQRMKGHSILPCWEQKACIDYEDCPAWEFNSGTMCWYLNGTLCAGKRPSTYEEKLLTCKLCNIFSFSGLLVETSHRWTHPFSVAVFDNSEINHLFHLETLELKFQ